MKIPYLNKMRYVFALLLSRKGSQSYLERDSGPRLLLAPHTHFDTCSKYPCLSLKMGLENFVGVSHLHFNVQCPLVLPYSIDLNSNYFFIREQMALLGVCIPLCALALVLSALFSLSSRLGNIEEQKVCGYITTAEC